MIDAIIGHLVGDYLFQTDWMAQNKKKSSIACLAHCLVYIACVYIFSDLYWAPLTFIFLCHFIQDRTQIIRWWMSIVSPGFTKEPLAPWSIIVVDNIWHLVQIWLAYKFF